MAVPPTIDNTLGALFVTALVTATLYGAGMLQGWFYFRKYRKTDPWAIQALVGFVLLCDTVQEALICMAVYQYAVTLHGDPNAMARMEKAIIVELYFGGALAFAVQTFYCWRIQTLSKNYFLSSFVWLTAWASIVSIYVYSAISINYSSLGDLLELANFATALNATNAACDVLITLAMIYCLQSSKTGFKRTTDMINRMIIFTFNTGMPTSLCAILDLVFLHALPNTFIYMSMYLTMDRFYTNCLLVTLNSRKYIKDADNSTHDTIALQTTNAGYSFEHRPNGGAISIQIDKSVHRDTSAQKEYQYTPEKSEFQV